MFRFIHIPKTGGTAVVKWFADNGIEFRRGQWPKGHGIHRTAANYLQEDMPRYCIVRDPYTRLVSYYNYISPCEGWNDFEEFVQGRLNNQIFKIPTPWSRQSEWTHYQGRQVVDKIFRYENLEQELQQHFGIDVPVPRENVSVKTVTIEDLTAPLRKIVAEHFARDFEYFGYDI